jgi:hypothetical protein
MENYKSKWWYRVLKVIYYFAIILGLLMTITLWTDNYSSIKEAIYSSIIFILVYITILKTIKISLRYIILGVPPKNILREYFKGYLN